MVRLISSAYLWWIKLTILYSSLITSSCLLGFPILIFCCQFQLTMSKHEIIFFFTCKLPPSSGHTFCLKGTIVFLVPWAKTSDFFFFFSHFLHLINKSLNISIVMLLILILFSLSISITKTLV